MTLHLGVSGVALKYRAWSGVNRFTVR